MSPRDDDKPASEEGEAPLAAEFVLGLVQGDQRDALEKRRRDDYVFAREVEFWEARLGPISSDIKPEAVSPEVWEKIAEAVGHRPVPLSASAAVRAEREGIWNSLAFWRNLGIASSALAAACLVYLLTTPASPPTSLVAALTMNDGSSAFMASVDRMTGRVMLMPAADMPMPADRTYQLWIVPPDGTPVSLGMIKSAGAVTISMPNEVMSHAMPQSALVVSIEPMGGSPTGAPTGPVLAKGMMHDI
jgi:anti-sigma-K factor RskA